MSRTSVWVVGIALAVLGATAGRPATAEAQEKKPAVTSAWVKLPAAGATSTEAYAVVENPTMYAFYLLSASSDAAGSVEIRQAGKDTKVEEVTVPAYGDLEMEPKGYFLILKDLKKPLNEGDTIDLTVVTEVGDKLSVQATVKKP